MPEPRNTAVAFPEVLLDQSSISVVVPILNESALLPSLLEHLATLDAREILIVDGGSTDGTWEHLHDTAGRAGVGRMRRRPRVYRSDAGRARQMNTGALLATGEVLLFLHADTRLPRGALGRVGRALECHPDRRWGRFDIRFDHSGALLRLVAWSMNRRSALSSICTGDQALFVYRRDFLELGGFAPVALMEDVDLSRRLKRRSRPVRISEHATTSSRRWRVRGVVRTIILMWRLRWLYWWGVPTSVLSRRYYPDHRWKPS